MKQEIISYRKIIKPERSTLRVLERRVEGFLPEELEDYFDDIVDSAERIWDLLDNYKEVVDGLESTNESVLAHRQNDVLRLLTVISVTILPLTLVTGLFGMNVALPRRGHARGVLGDRRSRCSSISAATLGFFRWRALALEAWQAPLAVARILTLPEARVRDGRRVRLDLGARAVTLRGRVERVVDAVATA